MRKFLFNQAKGFFSLTAILLLFAGKLAAQTYYENFESLTKTSYSGETITLNNVMWNFTGANAGSTALDFFVGTKSARLAGTTKLVSNPDTSKLEMLQNKPGGIGQVSFLYKRYGNDAQKTWAVQWSSDGITWLLMDTIRPTDTLNLFSYTLNQANARIRIYAIAFAIGSANTNRFNIDSLVITNKDGTILAPAIIAKEPEGFNISLATNELHITYDTSILAGAGSITLHQVNGSNQNFPVPAPGVIINGAHVTISGILLENASDYYVTMDSGTFKDATGTTATNGISSTTAWAFSTVDTIRPIPLMQLNESFTTCDFNTNTLGIFRQYSVRGSKTWNCSSYAHTDSGAVYINGGFATGSSEANEDWLISALPFDFSAMTNPVLSLWQKSRFEGNVSRDIRVSSDYSGFGNPNAASWTSLNVPELNAKPTPSNIWNAIHNISLNAFKGIPFYLAFTYECGTTGAWELTYDDIMVQEATTITNLKIGNFNLQVIGEAKSNQITLSFDSEVNAPVTTQIVDLAGRVLHTETFILDTGRQTHTLSNLALTSGMYLIQVRSKRQFGVVKAMVKS